MAEYGFNPELDLSQDRGVIPNVTCPECPEGDGDDDPEPEPGPWVAPVQSGADYDVSMCVDQSSYVVVAAGVGGGGAVKFLGYMLAGESYLLTGLNTANIYALGFGVDPGTNTNNWGYASGGGAAPYAGYMLSGKYSSIYVGQGFGNSRSPMGPACDKAPVAITYNVDICIDVTTTLSIGARFANPSTGGMETVMFSGEMVAGVTYTLTLDITKRYWIEINNGNNGWISGGGVAPYIGRVLPGKYTAAPIGINVGRPPIGTCP